MYRQLRGFNQSAAGKIKGFCLRNVRLGYGIQAKYANAITAWNHTQQHRDRNVPLGVDVPLFYTWGSDGHINVRLADGRVWSDGEIFSSIADYEAKREPNFIGWGESVNDVRVIEYVAETSKMPPVGAKIKITVPRTTFRAGTTTVAGYLNAPSSGWVYTVRGYDPKYPNRILINSASAGGDGIALALYYTNGTKIGGWTL